MPPDLAAPDFFGSVEEVAAAQAALDPATSADAAAQAALHATLAWVLRQRDTTPRCATPRRPRR